MAIPASSIGAKPETATAEAEFPASSTAAKVATSLGTTHTDVQRMICRFLNVQDLAALSRINKRLYCETLNVRQDRLNNFVNSFIGILNKEERGKHKNLIKRLEDLLTTETTSYASLKKYKQDIIKELKKFGDDILRSDRFTDLTEIANLAEFGSEFDKPFTLAALANIAQKEQEERGKAVELAAKAGDLSKVMSLLAKDSPIQQNCRGKAVIAAALAGRKDILMVLLANGAEFQMAFRGIAVSAAASNDRMDLVEILLADGAKLLLEDRGTAVCLAAHHSLAVLQALVANGPISKKAWGIAVCNAAQGRLDNLKFLLDNGPTISPEIGSPDNMNRLLANVREPDGTICYGTGNMAIRGAALQGRLDIVQYLLDKGAQLSQVLKDDIVSIAHKQGRFIVEKFIKELKIN